MKARMSDGTPADIKAVWFENGKVRMIGDAKKVCDLYIKEQGIEK